jgi:hypothetical protein
MLGQSPHLIGGILWIQNPMRGMFGGFITYGSILIMKPFFLCVRWWRALLWTGCLSYDLLSVAMYWCYHFSIPNGLSVFPFSSKNVTCFGVINTYHHSFEMQHLFKLNRVIIMCASMCCPGVTPASPGIVLLWCRTGEERSLKLLCSPHDQTADSGLFNMSLL